MLKWIMRGLIFGGVIRLMVMVISLLRALASIVSFMRGCRLISFLGTRLKILMFMELALSIFLSRDFFFCGSVAVTFFLFIGVVDYAKA